MQQVKLTHICHLHATIMSTCKLQVSVLVRVCDMQAEETALMAVDRAAAERRIHSALQSHVSQSHVSQLRQQLEAEQRERMMTEVQHQVEEERSQQVDHKRQQMQQEVAQAVAQEAAQEAASQRAAQLASAAQQESARAEQAAAAQLEAAQSAEEQAQVVQGQLVGQVKGFMKVAKEGVRKRQAALQYARSSWQVPQHDLQHLHH